MKYGYARTLTKWQATNGNSIEDQIKKLEAEGCEKIDQEAFTGTKTDRPQFNELLSKLEDGDILVITKLDRFARTTVNGIKTVRELFDRGVRVHILNMGIS